MSISENEGEVPAVPDEGEQLLAEEIGESGLVAIDQAILSVADLRWRKVASIVVRAGNTQGIRLTDDHVNLYVRRVIRLIEAGQLESVGNVRRPRWSEVRLPQSGIARG